MADDYQSFWTKQSFAVVGDKEKKNFPILTYRGLKQAGKEVFAVDPNLQNLEGDVVYPSLKAIPQAVEAVVLETPREDTLHWLRQAADLNVMDVWIHMWRDTPEALQFAQDRGMRLRYGRCAVMYHHTKLSYHSVHRWLVKAWGSF